MTSPLDFSPPEKKPIEHFELENKRLQAENEKRAEVLSYLGHLRQKGDAITDAYLYASGQRDDEWVFVELYGLTPREVGVLSSNRKRAKAGLEVINEWSTRVRRYGDKDYLPEEFKDAFYRYIDLLKKYILPEEEEKNRPHILDLHAAADDFLEVTLKMDP